jgi:hypothetical protein
VTYRFFVINAIGGGGGGWGGVGGGVLWGGVVVVVGGGGGGGVLGWGGGGGFGRNRLYRGLPPSCGLAGVYDGNPFVTIITPKLAHSFNSAALHNRRCVSTRAI